MPEALHGAAYLDSPRFYFLSHGVFYRGRMNQLTREGPKYPVAI